MTRALGLLASATIVGMTIVACGSPGDVGYVEIKTVPAVPLARTVLYLDSTKIAPIKEGDAILRQRIGTLKLEAGGFTGALTALCEIVVSKDRITTVTVSVLERPPQCQCRHTGTDAATAHQCVS